MPHPIGGLRGGTHRRALVQLDTGGDDRQRLHRAIIHRQRNGVEIGPDQQPDHALQGARIGHHRKLALVFGQHGDG